MSHNGEALKQKNGTKTMPVPMICNAAHAVGYEIGLPCGESRRDMVFYTAASGVTRGKKKPASQNDASPCDLFRSGCCQTRNWFIMGRMPA